MLLDFVRLRWSSSRPSISCGLRMELYQDTPLPLKEFDAIRLVKLEPGQLSESLLCELFQVLLSSSLSYTWGDLNITSTLCCSGCALTITANLETAPFSVRDKVHTRILWIDAICINQQ